MLPSAEQLTQMLTTGALGCVIASAALLLFGILGFIVVRSRGKSFGRSIQYSIFVVMLALVFPAICGVATYVAYNATSGFMGKAERAPGVVVGQKEGRMQEGGIGYSAIVEYTASNEKQITFEDHSGRCSPPCHAVGDKVTVIYDPDNPAGASIDIGIGNWIWTLVFGSLTLIFLLLALGLIWRAYRTNSNSLVIGQILDAIEP
jgi:hypothetical protein